RRCADAIIRTGIARVVSALEDPNPEVTGQGHERLRANGVAVEIGLGAEEARRTHAGHIARVNHGRPHVTLKLAVSADGKAGLAGPKQGTITREGGPPRGFLMGAMRDALPVWICIVLAHDPQFTRPLPGMFVRAPVRVAVDSDITPPLS